MSLLPIAAHDAVQNPVALNLINEALSADTLAHIFDYLIVSKDFQAGAVCRIWRAVVGQLLNTKVLQLQPLMGLPAGSLFPAISGMDVFTAFNRFVLAAFGQPLTKEKVVLSLPDVQAYEKQYTESLMILWDTLIQQLDFGTESVPVTPEEIKVWMHVNTERLQNIQALTITNRRMKVLPLEIALLTNLRMLNLSSTSIEALCPSLSDLTSLEVLDLSFTPLKELPENFHQLVNLRVLNIQQTKIQELPASVHQLLDKGRLNTLIVKFQNVNSKANAITRLKIDSTRTLQSTGTNLTAAMLQISKKSLSN